jgi:hypothetical protein
MYYEMSPFMSMRKYLMRLQVKKPPEYLEMIRHWHCDKFVQKLSSICYLGRRVEELQEAFSS